MGTNDRLQRRQGRRTRGCAVTSIRTLGPSFRSASHTRATVSLGMLDAKSDRYLRRQRWGLVCSRALQARPMTAVRA